MSTPEPPTPTPPSLPTETPSGTSTKPTTSVNPSTTTTTANTTVKPPPEPLKPLTGFRAALEHTGLPRGVLLWKPRLPSRNWCIFWGVLGSVSYLYWDDRRQCKAIKADYLARAKELGDQPLTSGGLGEVRKVKVWAGKWPEDDDTDRGARYFRKYIKPYLVAAAIDYQQISNPLHGSITRQVHADVLKRRRQALGLEQAPTPLSLPGAMDPAGAAQRELEGGTIIVGRASLKEYLEGLRRGWTGGVGKWDWEEEIKGQIAGDGVFDKPQPKVEMDVEAMGEEALIAAAEKRAAEAMAGMAAESSSSAAAPASAASTTPASTAAATPSSLSGLGFLSRPRPPPGPSISSVPQADGTVAQIEHIPAHLHIPPTPLPAQPPILLVPWVNPMGFKQVPRMIYDYFTERYRVREGAELAWALIQGETREFVGPAKGRMEIESKADTILADAASTASLPSVSSRESDLDFDRPAEEWYTKDFASLPSRYTKAREDYYAELAKRLESIRQLAAGERELTKEEAKSTKPLPTEDDLQKERLKKELRWKGMEEGWGIVKQDKEATWDPRFEGWLRVFKKEGE